jgi:hypothetical protein
MTVEAIVTEARAWMGTPYHHHARIKGVGVDCAQLLCEVYEAVGLVPHIDTGHYPHDWHLHRGEELFMEWLDRVGAPRIDPPAARAVPMLPLGSGVNKRGINVIAP